MNTALRYGRTFGATKDFDGWRFQSLLPIELQTELAERALARGTPLTDDEVDAFCAERGIEIWKKPWRPEDEPDYQGN